MADHNILGEKGEQAAVDYLISQGYKIIRRNWTYQKYEIDIIAQNEEFCIFVEVKTRASKAWSDPVDAVTKGKMRRIIEAADFYLNEYEIDLPPRFDIIAITLNKGKFEIEHIDDAFLPSID